MTWVLGAAPPFGYAALIADTRVSWQSKSYADVLLKVHRVGSMMLVGFAGSVRLGFLMVEDMQRCFVGAPDQICYPRVAAWTWHRRGRRYFAEAPKAERDLGCSLLLSGVSGISNGIPGLMRSYCIRMQAPDFSPVLGSGMAWLSIGSGSAHELAIKLAQRSAVDFASSAQAEIAFPGGYASMTASSLSTHLARTPFTGVSEALVVAHAFGDRITIQPIKGRVDLGQATEREIGPGPLARNRGEFERWCKFAGVTAAEGVA